MIATNPVRAVLVKRLDTSVILTLVLLFCLCQVAGATCPPPDLPLGGFAVASDDPMACPMPSGWACQPQLTSSQGREGEDGHNAQQDDQSSLCAVGVPFTLTLLLNLSIDVLWSTVLPPAISPPVSVQVLRI